MKKGRASAEFEPDRTIGIPVCIPADLVEDLRSLAERRVVQLCDILLAGFQCLLARYGLSSVVAFRVPTSEKPEGSRENGGILISAEVLRGSRFDSLVHRVSEMSVDQRSELDDSSMHHTEEWEDASAWFEYRLAKGPQSVVPLEYDMRLALWPQDSEILGWVEFEPSRVGALAMFSFGRRFVSLLKSAEADPQMPVTDLEFLSAAERHALLVEWNDLSSSRYDRFPSIPASFEAQAAKRPEAIAVVCRDGSMTYGELNEHANRMGRYLRRLGVGPEDLVGLLLERSLELIVGLLGILKAGGAYLPLDPNFPEERLHLMVLDSGARAIVQGDHLAHGFSEDFLKSEEVVSVTWSQALEEMDRESATDLERRDDSEHLAYVTYTSGSTGRPKGVSTPHRGVLRLVVESSYVEMGEEEVFLQFAPVGFDASTFEIWGPLLNGGQLAIMPPAQPDLEELGCFLREFRVSTLWLTAGLFHLMVDSQLKDLLGVRQLLAGGDSLSAPHVKKVLERLPSSSRLVNGYGPTEGTTFATCHAMRRGTFEQDGGELSVPIGRPIDWTRVHILDDAMHLVPMGASGELFVGGAGTSRGYLHRPALTAERFVPDPFSDERGAILYRTGDMARYRSDGAIEFLGRFDYQIKIRGFRIELGEIEAVLADSPRVLQAAVVTTEGALGDRRLAAYVLPRSGGGDPGRVDIGELRAFLAMRLPEHMIPAHFVTVDSLPLGPNGKIDRRALSALEIDTTIDSRAAEYVAPRTPTEEIVVGIWQEVLRVEGVGVESNFFDLGGHSLLVTQLLSRLRGIFGVDLSMGAFFDSPTVGGVASTIEQIRTGHAGVPVEVPRTPDGLPLSFSQQRLWFLDRLEGGSSVYNLSFVMRLRGRLNVRALIESIREIVRRHEVLRTSFLMVEDGVFQRAYPDPLFELTFVDLQRVPSEQDQDEHIRLAYLEAERPFDLEKGPLLRVVLLRTGAQDHTLLLTVHHIVFDGWSAGIFKRELSAIYRAFSSGFPSPLPELAIQYADFALWHRKFLETKLESLLAYWRAELAGLPQAVDLPIDRPRSGRSTRGRTHIFRVDPRTFEQLRRRSREQDATLFMLLLGVFNILLARYSRQTDISVGTPIAGRTVRETEPLIGFFVNTLVLRTQVEATIDLSTLVGRVRDTSLGAFAHQDLPFDRLVEALEPERNISQTPLFNVMMAFQGGALGGLDMPELEGSFSEQASRRAMFDLMLSFTEENEALEAELNYRTDLFDHSTICRIAKNLDALLRSIAEEPESRICDLEFLDAGERHQLLVEWNFEAEKGRAPVLWQEAFESQAMVMPQATALIVGDVLLSYRALASRSELLARLLRSYGVGPEVLVGIYLDRSVDLVVAVAAILRAGGAYVPLDPQYPKARVAFMLEDSHTKVLLTRGDLLMETGDRFVVELDSDWEQGASRLPPLGTSTAYGDSLAYVIYTSGSTGRPKGVAVRNSGIAALLEWSYEVFDREELAGVFAATSICFDISVFEILVTLGRGGTVIVGEHVLTLQEVPAAARVTLLNTVPTALAELLMLEALPPAVSTINLAGEALSRELTEKAYAQPGVARVYNLYGPTEDTTYSLWERVPVGESGAPRIGRPVTGTWAHVLDDVGYPVPIGAKGEIYVGGDGLARGYLGRPALTAARFLPDPLSDRNGARLYRSGDLGRRLSDSRLEYLGRFDHQVKIRGFRIELGEIERALANEPGIGEAVVTIRDALEGPGLVAYLIRDGENLSIEEVRRNLSSALPDYMVPGAFGILDALPLTPNGKVDRRALERIAPVQLRREFVAPTTPIEEQLVMIWCEVLGLDQIGVDDLFFQLGGHSLSAVRALSRVHKVFGVELPTVALFQNPTVRGLSKRIEEALRPQETRSEIHSIHASGALGPVPLSFDQERLWFLEDHDPGLPLYNLAIRWRIQGDLRPVVLAAALTELTRRHEVLRSRFLQGTDGPVAQIETIRDSPLPLVDLSALGTIDRNRELSKQSAFEAQCPICLDRGYPQRATLLKLGSGNFCLFLTLHHIVCDAWSLEIIEQELRGLYRSIATGEPSPLAPLSIQYSDYARWQRHRLRGKVLEDELDYWRRRLSGVPELLSLPTDRPRPSVAQSYQGATQLFVFPSELGRRLENWSRQRTVTLFMTLLAGFEIFLSRITHQKVLLVGSPVANRDQVEVERLVGLFLNTLALRCDLSRDPSFDELVRQVQKATLEDFEHKEVPFEKVVNAVRPKRTLSYAPLLQTMLILQRGLDSGVSGTGSSWHRYEEETQTAKFELSLVVTTSSENFTCAFEYRSELFDRTTISRFGQGLRILLEGIVSHPDWPVSRLPIMAASQIHQTLIEWNVTPDLAEAELAHYRVEERVEERSDAIAMVVGDRFLTYEELDRRANNVASHLLLLGLSREELVGIAAVRSPELLIGLLGVLKAGGAYVPLDPRHPAHRLNFMLRDSDCSILLTSHRCAESFRKLGVMRSERILELEEVGDSARSEFGLEPRRQVQPDQLAYLIYTSGSTGKPKAVAIEHRSLAAFLDWATAVFSQEELGSVFAGTTIGFDVSVFELLAPLAAGGTVLMGEDSLALADLEGAGRTTLVSLVPSVLTSLIEARAIPKSVRTLVLAGERLSEGIVEEFFRFAEPIRLLNLYGPTEDTVYSTLAVLTPGAAGNPPIGRPITGKTAYLLDQKVQPVQLGVIGELFLTGCGVARSYFDRRALTAERFVPNPFGEPGSRLYRTGDLARHLRDGLLDFHGRADHQVKIRGFRVELEEIEAVLCEHPAVFRSALYADGDQLVANIVLAQSHTAMVDEIRSYLTARLPSFMIPTSIHFYPELPQTPAGKLDREALRRYVESQPMDRWAPPVPPSSETERALAGIWREVLEVEKVGRFDNFFELGGHSLMTFSLRNRVRRKFQVVTTVREIFEHSTLAAMAARIDEVRQSSPRLPLDEEPLPKATWIESEKLLGFFQVLMSLRGELSHIEKVLGSVIRERARKLVRKNQIRFPAVCHLGEKVELEVQITVEGPIDPLFFELRQITSLESYLTRTLMVRLTAPGFQIESNHGVMRIPVDGDSNALRFTFVPQVAGRQLIEIEMFSESNRVGYITVESKVVEGL